MLYEFQCENSHKRDVFEHRREDLGCRTIVCEECGYTMGPIPSYGSGLGFFGEGRGHWITNLGTKPVYVTSYAQHRRLMREAGVIEGGASLPNQHLYAKGRWI